MGCNARFDFSKFIDFQLTKGGFNGIYRLLP